MMRPTTRVLATDLDGTFIPLEGVAGNREDLRQLERQLVANDVTLVFVTGRHLESVLDAIGQHQLPSPEWIICDVGSSIYKREPGGYGQVDAYQEHEAELVATMPIASLREQLNDIDGLRLQEEEKQGRFKLSYYVDAGRLAALTDRIQARLGETSAPYSIIASVDPFNGDGLIDLLPARVSKAHALSWWVAFNGWDPESIVFSGDSGNDLAALTAGFRAILVGNADRSLARRVYDAHRDAGWNHRLYLAKALATSGVLEGCRWFGLAEGVHDAGLHRFGATPVGCDRTGFRVWAPGCESIEVELLDESPSGHRRVPLARSDDGFFRGCLDGVAPGSRYFYRLDGSTSRPDPAAHFQPEGVHGPSMVIDHESFPWSDGDWKGIAKRNLVIYELHVGAFTEEGTFLAAGERLAELKELGVNAIEIMPVAQAPGRWNWGYDGVDLFAVCNTYGGVDQFKGFVDACHREGFAVILDVVYNHVGPEGNYLSEFGPYISERHHSPWGGAPNFDGPHCETVRAFVLENVLYWLDAFHLDGLRLDAVHYIEDERQPSILDEISRVVADYADTVPRQLHLIAETNVYDPHLVSSTERRRAYDALWGDCMLHAIYSLARPEVQLTNRRYRGASDVVEALRYGYVFRGIDTVHRPWRHDDPSLGVEKEVGDVSSLVISLQTHDSVGNHPSGSRLHQLTSTDFQRAAATLTLLYPSIPMLFMGEETSAEAPFPFFADFGDKSIRDAVDEGRAREYPPPQRDDFLAPSSPEAFERAKLSQAVDRDDTTRRWYQSLLTLRRLGVAQGWLAADRLEVRGDHSDGLFGFAYTCAEGGSVVVVSRLTAPSQSSAPVITIDREGEIVLATAGVDAAGDARLSLGPNQAVVMSTSSALEL
ncbi:Malto-oligosyltrehalose trehalohydrolase [Planctomycetes bacterium Pan216]|uniref:Malto-oligosyltrehalose trehalohydrolase n=1 Tax=Kolteria novifilia TaxID=2527975 RepID=A0A518AXB8_9BACT|nr:Malto-oligosyltrehalose trehalohydrolase [Planctomycetes bacterium Pan216]